jgi:hypothetical protein
LKVVRRGLRALNINGGCNSCFTGLQAGVNMLQGNLQCKIARS